MLNWFCYKLEIMRKILSKRWPIAVIGGGVVGCAIAREFTLAGRAALLLEKGKDILSGTSKANSSIFHSGFDAKPDTLELQCIRIGRQEFFRCKDEMKLPILETSAILAANTKSELDKLPEIRDQALNNQVDSVSILNQSEVQQKFPWLNRNILGGLFIQGEDVIDPWSTPLAYAQHAIENGASILRSCKVLNGALENGVWNLETTAGRIEAETVINASGVAGDIVEKIRGEPKFSIKPRKGQFVVFDKYASTIVKTIVLPHSTKVSKGVLLAPTIFGNVIVGPTAEEQHCRSDTSVDQGTLKKLIQHAHLTVPALASCPITASYAGIRPATEHDDYQIHPYPNQQWISVAGIRSTGLTAALGIAKYVAGLYGSQFEPLKKLNRIRPVAVPNLAEHLPRAYQQGFKGEIVCHCEQVTRAEIEDAMSSALPATDVEGLKRRTRCLMGRCQGFYCASRLWELTRDKIHWPIYRDQIEVHETA